MLRISRLLSKQPPAVLFPELWKVLFTFLSDYAYYFRGSHGEPLIIFLTTELTASRFLTVLLTSPFQDLLSERLSRLLLKSTSWHSSCKLCYFDDLGFRVTTISGLVTCYLVPLLLLAISLFRENFWLPFSFPFGFVIRLPRLRYNLLINVCFITTFVVSDLRFTSPTHLSIGYYQAVLSSAFC